MKQIAMSLLCFSTLLAATSVTHAKDITVRYNQIDSSYNYDDSNREEDVTFSGPTVRLTGEVGSLKGAYAEIGYLSESDTKYEADMINLGAGLTHNFYNNNNFYIDGSIGANLAKYDANYMSESLYYAGVPVKAQLGVQKNAMRAFIEVGYRHDWALNQDDEDYLDFAQPTDMGGIELGVGVRYNFDYGWWSPASN